MAKQSTPKNKSTIFGNGPKPEAMKQPPEGQAKMVGRQAKPGKKGRSAIRGA